MIDARASCAGVRVNSLVSVIGGRELKACYLTDPKVSARLTLTHPLPHRPQGSVVTPYFMDTQILLPAVTRLARTLFMQ